MAGVARMANVALEAADPVRLAEFYRDLTGMNIVYTSEDWITLKGPNGGTALCIQQAPGHQPPRWPDPASSMQAHVDFWVDDLDAAEEVALRLGATKFDHQPGTSFRVYADPAGHPFCLCLAD
jgi:catechol 2,3-dioxygenase-like lactoylglutathione lyase family enzyme